MEEHSKALLFPEGFLWGTATAAHQVEGGNRNNDWWEWERQPGKIADGTTSETACDQYDRYESDFDMLKKMGHNAHRLSVEWSRVEPEAGSFSAEAIEHYRKVLQTLRDRNIEPMLTLHHFTNPLWLAKMGGWENPKVVEYFTRYAKIVAGELGDLVRLWVTINEPAVYAHLSYIEGIWPPGAASMRGAAVVITNMLRAHGLAYHILHEVSPNQKCSVGIAKHIRILDPMRRRHPLDALLARFSDFIFNRWFLDAIQTGRLAWPIGMGQQVQLLSATHDFIGLNYYTREMIRFRPWRPKTLFMEYTTPPGCSVNELGWEIYPEGLYRALMRLKSYNKPIYVTENGIATADDSARISYLKDHLAEIHRAISEGAEVCGYFYWSLIDNFEWAEGLTPRFGLVAVEYDTQQRSPRPSAGVFSEIARKNKLDPAWFEQPR